MRVVPSPSDSEPNGDIERLSESMLALQEALGGRYVLERELGKGGMGVVYLAWEAALDRLVALKVLPPGLATPGRRERFLGEARIAARLKHDHIVPIHAVDEAGPFVYYAMDYIEGETLAERILAEGALPVGEVTRILHDVARAVEYAHERGVVHRDLKPQNILLESESGRAYVADFGLARVLGDDPLPGRGGGRTFGTLPYVSPEQASGLPADRRSDVYSLGVVGYVMATARPLFSGSPREILEQHISRPAPPLPVLGRHLDTTLAGAVARCLAKDPRERFQSAGELARDLAAAPELRSDLPVPLRDFLARLELESRSAPGAIALGLVDLSVLTWAIEGGQWGVAAAAMGFLGLLAASPVVGALPATRRLLGRGYGRADILHALNMDLDCQRERLAARWGRARDATATVLRRVAAAFGGLFGLGVLAAVSGADLPLGPVIGAMIVGAFGSLLAGGFLLWRERRRNELSGLRWLRFWDSRLGAWTVKLAGLGLGRVPVEPVPVAFDPTGQARPAEAARGALPNPFDDYDEVVGRTASNIRRVREHLAASSVTRRHEPRRAPASPDECKSAQILEDRLAMLEALLDRLRQVDPITGVPGSLTADLEAAREICEAVEGMLEGGGSRSREP